MKDKFFLLFNTAGIPFRTHYSTAFAINPLHTRGLFTKKCITMCADMNILKHFNTNNNQSEYAFLFPFSIYTSQNFLPNTLYTWI